jgi:hypothetical protein
MRIHSKVDQRSTGFSRVSYDRGGGVVGNERFPEACEIDKHDERGTIPMNCPR